VLANPLDYVAKGMCGAMTPDLPHVPFFASTAALLGLTVLLALFGSRSCAKRALG
jgi:hypothetical protein